MQRQLAEYDGKKHFIRHIKTPDASLKNDCLIRALCEVTGKSYYNICLKLRVPYVASGYHHSIPDTVEGVTIAQYERAFSNIIERSVAFADNCYVWYKILADCKSGKLPTVERFTKTYSRRKEFKDKKLILHCFSADNNIYHAIYCKNGYYYDSNNHDDWYVVYFNIFK